MFGSLQRRVWFWPLLLAVVGVAGCEALLGLDEFGPDPTEGVGGDAGATTTGQAGTNDVGGGGDGPGGAGGGGAKPEVIEGNVLWARAIGGDKNEQARALAVNQDFVFIAGHHATVLDLDAGLPDNCSASGVMLPRDEQHGVPFLAGFSHDGCTEWGMSLDQASNPGGSAESLAAPSSGDPWVAVQVLGDFYDLPPNEPGWTAAYGQPERPAPGPTTFKAIEGLPPEVDEIDPIVVVDASGRVIIATTVGDAANNIAVDTSIVIDADDGSFDRVVIDGGPGADVAHALTATPVGLFVAGVLAGSASLGGGCAASPTDRSGFVALVDIADGSCVWSAYFGGGEVEVLALAFAATPVNNVLYVGGRFSGNLQLPGGGALAAVEEDAFLLELDAATGVVLRHRVSGGAGNERILALATTSFGTVVAAGEFSGLIGFDQLLEADNKDGFVMGWNASLQPEWLSVLSGDHDQRFVRLATSSGRVFALGEQALTATLGKFTLPHVPSASGGTAFDLVLAAFDEAPTVR